jgi:hypothetical protein
VAPASVANGNFQRQPGFYLAMVLAFTALMVVGAVIVAHRPGNAIGWIFSAVGLLSSAGALGMEYAEYAYVTRPGSLPGAVVAASIAHWYWNPLLGLILVFTPLLFPTGRLLSARWRPVALVAAVGMAAMTVLVALQPTIRLQNEDYTVRNPIGLAGVPDPEEGVLGAVLLGLLFGCMAAAVASVGVAVPPLPGVERQQLKWFSYAAALMAVSFLLWGFLLPAGGVTDVVFGLTIALVPVAAGIAILATGCTTSTGPSTAPWSTACSPPCSAPSMQARCSCLGSCSAGWAPNRRAGQSLAPPWRWQRCSSRRAAASRRSWVGVRGRGGRIRVDERYRAVVASR